MPCAPRRRQLRTNGFEDGSSSQEVGTDKNRKNKGARRKPWQPACGKPAAPGGGRKADSPSPKPGSRVLQLRQYLAELVRNDKGGGGQPRLCAHVLARQVLGLDRIARVTQADRELIVTRELIALDVLEGSKPRGTASATGSREFYGRDFR